MRTIYKYPSSVLDAMQKAHAQQRVPDAKAWCAKNAHMLEILSPIDVVIAWEEFRVRSQSDAAAKP